MSRLEYLDLPSAKHAQGVVTLPGSKSISNRVLLLSALAQGRPGLRVCWSLMTQPSCWLRSSSSVCSSINIPHIPSA